jgi:hypothetical protein
MMDKVSGFSFRKLSEGVLVSANTIGVRGTKTGWLKPLRWKVFILKETIYQDGASAYWRDIETEAECIALMEAVEMALALVEKTAVTQADADVANGLEAGK